jgi:Domain of unknown function (DUF3598)
MNSNWDNFVKNLGEWPGSFTDISPTGEFLSSTSSILSLEKLENDQPLVSFRMRRYSDSSYSEPPVSDYAQVYQTIGRQNVFFDTGAFSKGTIQLAPFSEFGAEYGFINEDRRWRCVQLFNAEHNFIKLVLMREFRSGSAATERPPLTVEQLIGQWAGQAVTAYADLRNPDINTTNLEIRRINGDRLEQKLSWGDRTISTTAKIVGHKLCFEDSENPREILLLPDGGSSNVPLQIQRHAPFFVEAGWLLAANERQRLMRSYNEKGEWISCTHIIEHKVG